MASWFGGVMQRLAKLAAPSPFTELGVGGTVMYGGYPGQDQLRPTLVGLQRWRKAQELLADVSIIAASVRYFLNLTSRPSWRADPPSDKPEAKAVAEFIESVINGCDTSWARIVRRQAMYRFHGFGIHEWTAKRRDDGKTGLDSIAVRPGHTIEKWELDDHGSVEGVWQRAPGTGNAIFLPRAKIIYLHDDMISDDPQGMGWYRHLVEPAGLIRDYLKLEKVGYQRDLAGTPVGRAPISAINSLIGKKEVPDGKGGVRLFNEADAQTMLRGMTDFVSVKSKQPDTGLLLDSQPFTSQTENGKTISSALQWDVSLLTGSSHSLKELGDAIKRLSYDMALIMGTENMLVGLTGVGSRALSEDKSRNLYMNVNATTGEMAESYDRDIVGPLCILNGIPDDLRPKLRCEDASFKDAQEIAATLKDMAAAGAVLSPDDPAIDDVRDLLGVAHQPVMDAEELALRAAVATRGNQGGVDNSQAGGGDTNSPTSTRTGAGK